MTVFQGDQGFSGDRGETGEPGLPGEDVSTVILWFLIIIIKVVDVRLNLFICLHKLITKTAFGKKIFDRL